MERQVKAAFRVPGIQDVGPFRSSVISLSRLAAFRVSSQADLIFSQNGTILDEHQDSFAFDDQHFVGLGKRCKSTSGIKHKTTHQKARTLSRREMETHYAGPEKQFVSNLTCVF